MLSIVTATACLFLMFNNAPADVIVETGSLGNTGVSWEQTVSQEVPGSNVASFSFVGTRFQIAQPVLTTHVGGHFVGGYEETSFFGALVALLGRDDFPDSEDLSTSDVLGVSILNFPHASADTRGELSLRLSPGWYALVFGTHHFGTDGRGAAVRNGLDIGSPSYIVWQDDPGWFNHSELSGANQPGNLRFIIEGTVIPEPSTGALLAIAMLSTHGLIRKRRCRRYCATTQHLATE
jgi:hypothetical protein